MRLWHYRLIPYLPKSQLIAQWRELNCIFNNEPRHILINYIYEYSINDLFNYATLVVEEMQKRGYKVNTKNADVFFVGRRPKELYHFTNNPFPNHHNDRYLIQCYYNLQEKYDRGQKDFSKHQMMQLYQLVRDEIGIPILEVK